MQQAASLLAATMGDYLAECPSITADLQADDEFHIFETQ
jgi:hypothetical protein